MNARTDPNTSVNPRIQVGEGSRSTADIAGLNLAMYHADRAADPRGIGRAVSCPGGQAAAPPLACRRALAASTRAPNSLSAIPPGSSACHCTATAKG